MSLTNEEEQRAAKLFAKSLGPEQHGPLNRREIRGQPKAVNPLGGSVHPGSLKKHKDHYGPQAKRTKFKGDQRIARAPDDAEGLLQRAVLLAAQGDLPGALAVLDRVLAREPANVAAQIRAAFRQRAGDLQGAQQDLATLIDPGKGAVGPPSNPAFEPEPGSGPIPHDPSQFKRRGEKD